MNKKQVFKREVLTRTKVRNNILKVWQDTTVDDKHDWYREAYEYAIEIADKHFIVSGAHIEALTMKVVGVIAALSPMTNWNQNKKLADQALQLWKSGLSPEQMPCLKVNARKAWRILDLGPSSVSYNESKILDILNGNKVCAFFLNICYPDQAKVVTIDRHALSIALGRKITDDQYRAMTAKQYEFFVQCYIWTALYLDVNPLILQSATWLVWRRK